MRCGAGALVRWRATCHRPVRRSALCPGFSFAGFTADRLSRSVQCLFGVEAIEDLSGFGEQFPGSVPDPGRAVTQHYATGGFGETAPCCFAQYALGEVGPVELVSVVAALSIEAEYVMDPGSRTGSPSSSRDSAVHTVTTLASRVFAEPSGCLPARPHFHGAHRHSGAIHPQVHGRRHFAHPFHARRSRRRSRRPAPRRLVPPVWRLPPPPPTRAATRCSPQSSPTPPCCPSSAELRV